MLNRSVVTLILSLQAAYDEGIIYKLVPGYSLNRFRKLRKEVLGEQETIMKEKPKFKFTRQA